MSTVKISQLPLITRINANTANTLFAGVDIVSGATGKMTAHTLAQGLFSNEILNVGTNPVVFTNTVSQFSGTDPAFLQINLQNFNSVGSADYIITGDKGTNSNNYIDLGLNGSAFQPNPTVGSAFLPNDGYLYIQGPTPSHQGNLLIGTASSDTHINFLVGGLNTSNIIATMTSSGLTMNTGTSITFADGSHQITAASPVSYSQAAFALANSVNTVATNANNSIANINSTLVSVNTSINYLSAVNATQNTSISNNSDNLVRIQGVLDTVNTSILTNATKLTAAFNKANTAFANTTGTFAGDLTTTGFIEPQKGFILVPTSYTGAQTAITIDFANDSVIRAQTATGLTTSLSNFTAGKSVEMWITNTSGSTQSFVHGVSATNSTTGSTVQNMPGNSTVHAKYMCFDGDLANTFVAITHA